MIERAHGDLAQACRDGIAALDHVLEHKPDHVHATIASATRCLCALRDAIIDAHRRGDPHSADLLAQINAVLSVLVACEFPLAGVRWQRLDRARHLLAELTDKIAIRVHSQRNDERMPDHDPPR